MNVLIVDDEAPARKRLIRLINSFADFNVIGEARNGQEAIDMCAKHEPEIVLMDVRMPGVDGMEAAKVINKSEHPPAIIYCTAYSDHALQAFATHAVDYLLKPVNKERLLESLITSTQLTKAQVLQQDIKSENKSVRQHICARVRGNLVLIAIDQIYFFQADQKYVTVHHEEGELLIEETLVSLENEYSGQFLRIHRNALVALDKIVGLVKSEASTHVTLKGTDKMIEISRRHLPSVRKVIKSL